MNLETSFCMESGQVKAGEDKDDTFVKMLQEIVRITPSIACGIASEYPNVVSLVKAFRNDGAIILEDLHVRFRLPIMRHLKLILSAQKSANRNGALTDRKIGPAISRRLFKVFTELDPASTDV